jgi:hypothetical protein
MSVSFILSVLSVTYKHFMLSVIMLNVVITECRYAGCHLYSVSFMLSVIRPNVVMLSVIMLNVVMLGVLARPETDKKCAKV